ncbi:MAG: sodium:proton antiporter [Candidatus Symbiodolus clandestinus]
MNVYYTLCFLAALAVGIAFLNQYIHKVQSTIAITAGALAGSLLLLSAGRLGWFHLEPTARYLVEQINFQEFLLHGILGFLLFAGALGINLPALRDQKWEVAILSLASTLLSTLLIGYAIYGIATLLHLKLALIYCMLFGALISPTDPIAVLAIIKTLRAPQRMAIQVEGESLFNDGVGLVIFITLFSVAFSHQDATLGSIFQVFFQEALGGIVYGLVVGFIAHWLISATDNGSLELLITLLIPSTAFSLANLLNISGALAMVVSGIIIGNWTRQNGFSKQSTLYLNHFWELIDQFLNALLFLLIGLTLLVIEIDQRSILLMLSAIPVCLAARYFSVLLPFACFRWFRHYNPYTLSVLTWGGLRGGLALAMALSIPIGAAYEPCSNIDIRDLLLVMCYSVVLFSILIQGSTIEPMIQRAKQSELNSQP